MTNTNVTNFRKDIYELLKQTIKFNEPINISTKDGNAILISESEYMGLIETLYLTTSPEIKDKLLKGKNTPKEKCLFEDEVEW